MFESLFFYGLVLYFFFHICGRSDLLAKPRNWLFKTFPWWVTYPLGCCFCFSWWANLVLGLAFYVLAGVVMLSPGNLFVVPVLNMVFDLLVRKLMVANEPPVMGEGKTIWDGSTGISTWRSPSVFVGTAATSLSAGQIVYIRDRPHDDSGRHFDHWGIGAVWPWPTDVGRRVKLTSNPYDPRGGRLTLGRTGVVEEVSPITCAWAYRVKADDGGDDFCCDPQACTFIDAASFNPLNHEQTK